MAFKSLCAITIPTIDRRHFQPAGAASDAHVRYTSIHSSKQGLNDFTLLLPISMRQCNALFRCDIRRQENASLYEAACNQYGYREEIDGKKIGEHFPKERKKQGQLLDID